MTERRAQPTKRTMMRVVQLASTASLLATGACVNVSAPDKPIEINLNISVKQEVVYRLDAQAKALIKDNPGVF